MAPNPMMGLAPLPLSCVSTVVGLLAVPIHAPWSAAKKFIDFSRCRGTERARNPRSVIDARRPSRLPVRVIYAKFSIQVFCVTGRLRIVPPEINFAG